MIFGAMCEIVSWVEGVENKCWAFVLVLILAKNQRAKSKNLLVRYWCLSQCVIWFHCFLVFDPYTSAAASEMFRQRWSLNLHLCSRWRRELLLCAQGSWTLWQHKWKWNRKYSFTRECSSVVEPTCIGFAQMSAVMQGQIWVSVSLFPCRWCP